MGSSSSYLQPLPLHPGRGAMVWPLHPQLLCTPHFSYPPPQDSKAGASEAVLVMETPLPDQWKEMFRGEDDRFSHCSDPSACLELAEKARNNDKMLKLYVTRLRDDILSRLMEKLNIKRVISMQKTKTNSALGFKQRPFVYKKITLP